MTAAVAAGVVWTTALAAFFSTASAQATPVQEVISLLSGLKQELENEANSEASSYEEFACFCKSTTETKSGSITTAQDDIDMYSATIQDQIATRTTKSADVEKRQQRQKTLSADLQESVVQCKKEQTQYEATAADLQKALTSLENAISSLESAKTSVGSFLAVRNSITESIHLAEALGMLQASDNHLASLLQANSKVDPGDPTYKFRSKQIIETLQDLETKFNNQKTDLDSEWEKTKTACKATQSAISGEMTTNGDAINQLKIDIDELTVNVATNRGILGTKKEQLEDDQQYLKDLTSRCEGRAKDWDQRSRTRADEVTAITQAIAILTDEVKGLDEAVNVRAMLLEAKATSKIGVKNGHMSLKSSSSLASPSSFLQQAAARNQPVMAHLQSIAEVQNAAVKDIGASSGHTAARQQRAAELLEKAGGRLESPVLSSLAVRLQADPFAKVKQLIQQLIERLLQESAAEATKKGWCDTEIGKAETEKGFRLASVESLAAEVEELKATKESLSTTIAMLRDSVNATVIDLEEARRLREEEKAENLKTMQNATQGRDAVARAITLLNDFYKSAARAKVLLQRRASPVDEDTSGPGFKGAYTGKQDSIRGVIGLLEVVKADFERTIRTTKDAEKQAAAGFVLLERSAKADAASESRQIVLDGEELRTTDTNLERKVSDLQTQMGLLDAALKTIVDLTPVCIDTGMTFSERTQKREDEIAALRDALCVLDPNNVEPSCPGSS